MKREVKDDAQGQCTMRQSAAYIYNGDARQDSLRCHFFVDIVPLALYPRRYQAIDVEACEADDQVGTRCFRWSIFPFADLV